MSQFNSFYQQIATNRLSHWLNTLPFAKAGMARLVPIRNQIIVIISASPKFHSNKPFTLKAKNAAIVASRMDLEGPRTHI